MTVKRRTPNDESSEEFKIRLGGRDYSWRVLVLVLLISATPPGQTVLKNFGITVPTAQEAVAVKNDMQRIRDEFAAFRTEFRAELKTVKDAQSEQRAEIKSLGLRFDGFQNDLESLKRKSGGTSATPIRWRSNWLPTLTETQTTN